MSGSRRSAPDATHVVRIIAGRELRLAARRWLVRGLFLLSLLPLTIFALILVISAAGGGALGEFFDEPTSSFVTFQASLVMLLALGIGAPMIARDRSEDVLFLYATRPVSPVAYAAGKFVAVFLPAFLLLFGPGLLITTLRVGILQHVSTADALVDVGLLAVSGVLIAGAYTGVCIGASALTQRGRWAFLAALGVFVVAAVIDGVLGLRGQLAPGASGDRVLRYFLDETGTLGFAPVVLVAWAALGFVAALRVRKEMVP